MKIMSIIISRITNKTIVVPPVDKQLLVERHPELIHLFPHNEQITILSRLWYRGKFSTSQCVALNPEMDAVIDDIIATCNME